MADSFNNNSLEYWRSHPVEFIETVLINPETGHPFELLPAERQFLEFAFTISPDGRLVYREWLYSCPRKSGKTTFEALIVITMVLLFGGAYPEAYLIANDQEQAQSRVFEMCRRIILASPWLMNEAQVTQYRIAFPAFKAFILAIASDAGGAAGSNAVCAGFDELWAYTSERSRRSWDELTPPPTRKIACRVTVTYAGFSGESVLLEELYRRGMQQPMVGDSLHAGDGLLMAWHTKPVAPWQDEAWLTEMRRQRASVYQRHVLNEFASSSSQFIDLSKWDRCVDPALGHVPVDLFLPVFIGVDASFKHDSTAICVVSFDQSRQQVRLVTHKVFQPTSEQPLDFELTVEAALLNMARSYQVQRGLFDPWQMQAVAQRLAKQGLPVEEFPQTSPNLTAASQNLFDLIESQGIVMYPDEQMRLAISRAVAIETPRGWRIGKQNQAHRIDLIIALCMGCFAATQGQKEPFFDRSWSFVDGRPIGATPASEQQHKAQAARDSADFYAARLQAYLLSGGGGNDAIPFNRDRTINWRRLPTNGSGF